MEQKNKQLMIFLAGELQSDHGVLKRITENNFDFYAADGGYQLAERLGVIPKKIIGDFDSAPCPKAKNVFVYPSEKDQTDSELTLDIAASDGYGDVWMIAPFGGRIDHTVANLCLLESAHEKRLNLTLYDGKNLAFLLEEGKHTIGGCYRYVSFFPWGASVEISLKDFKYPLDHYSLVRHKPIGVSNEPQGELPTIEVHHGMVLCICIENQQEDL